MCEIKRGAVLLIQAGDPEISGALAEGILAGRKMSNDLSRPFGAPSPEGEGLGTGRGLTEAQRRELARGVKEAVGNTKGPEDYALLRFEAEMEYGESLYEPGPMARLAEALLGAYALTVYRLHEMFDWEGSRWHGR